MAGVVRTYVVDGESKLFSVWFEFWKVPPILDQTKLMANSGISVSLDTFLQYAKYHQPPALHPI